MLLSLNNPLQKFNELNCTSFMSVHVVRVKVWVCIINAQDVHHCCHISQHHCFTPCVSNFCTPKSQSQVLTVPQSLWVQSILFHACNFNMSPECAHLKKLELAEVLVTMPAMNVIHLHRSIASRRCMSQKHLGRSTVGLALPLYNRKHPREHA